MWSNTSNCLNRSTFSSSKYTFKKFFNKFNIYWDLLYLTILKLEVRVWFLLSIEWHYQNCNNNFLTLKKCLRWFKKFLLQRILPLGLLLSSYFERSVSPCNWFCVLLWMASRREIYATMVFGIDIFWRVLYHLDFKIYLYKYILSRNSSNINFLNLFIYL